MKRSAILGLSCALLFPGCRHAVPVAEKTENEFIKLAQLYSEADAVALNERWAQWRRDRDTACGQTLTQLAKAVLASESDDVIQMRRGCYAASDDTEFQALRRQRVERLVSVPLPSSDADTSVASFANSYDQLAYATALVVGHHTNILATGGEHGRVLVFNGHSGKLISDFAATEHYRANELALSTSDRVLLTSSYFEPRVRLWDVRTGEPLATVERKYPGPFAELPGGRYWLMASSQDLLLADLTKDAAPQQVGKLSAVAQSMAVHENGQVAIGTAGGTIEMWTFAQENKSTVPQISRRLATSRGTGNWMKNVFFSLDGKSLYSVDRRSLVTRWNVDTLEPEMSSAPAFLFSSDAAISRDRTQIVVTGTPDNAGVGRGSLALFDTRWSTWGYAPDRLSNLAVVGFLGDDRTIALGSGASVSAKRADSVRMGEATWMALIEKETQEQISRVPIEQQRAELIAKARAGVTNTRAYEEWLRRTERNTLARAGAPRTAPSNVGVDPDFYLGAEVHAIGVYEAATAPKRAPARDEHPAGVVDVSISRKSAEVVLVLASYEPIIWRLQLGPDVVIRQIVLTGYYQSQVIGLPSTIPVLHTTLGYAYAQDDATARDFLSKLERTTGHRPRSFQTAYSGKSFSVH